MVPWDHLPLLPLPSTFLHHRGSQWHGYGYSPLPHSPLKVLFLHNPSTGGLTRNFTYMYPCKLIDPYFYPSSFINSILFVRPFLRSQSFWLTLWRRQEVYTPLRTCTRNRTQRDFLCPQDIMTVRNMVLCPVVDCKLGPNNFLTYYTPIPRRHPPLSHSRTR